MIDLFDQIRCLHDLEFNRGDIRPVNVIMLEGDILYLIDFVTASKIGETVNFINGTLPYVADDSLIAVPNSEEESENDGEEEVVANASFGKRRASYLEELKVHGDPENFNFPDLIAIFFNFIKHSGLY